MTEVTKSDFCRGMRHLSMAMRELDNFSFNGARNQMGECKYYLDKVARDVKMNEGDK